MQIRIRLALVQDTCYARPGQVPGGRGRIGMSPVLSSVK